MSTTAISASPLSPKMWLTTNSVRNTTVSLSDDSAYYEIVTRYWEPALTKINKLLVDDGRRKVPIAQIQESFSSKRAVSVPGSGTTPASSSINTTDQEQMEACGGTTKVKFRDTWINAEDLVTYDERIGASFKGDDGALYTWKTHNGRLQLITSDERGGSCILVQYHRPKRHLYVLKMSRHAFLEIKSPEIVEGIMDLMIISYILVERKRRHGREQPTKND